MKNPFSFFKNVANAGLPGTRRFAAESAPSTNVDPGTVTVRLLGPDGAVTDPVAVARVEKTDAEWKAQLTPEQYEIARGAGTERAFCGNLLDNKREGVYSCVCCGLPLFASQAKFNSRTGWPSFFQPIAEENVVVRTDNSHGMRREEILCARCDGHLGHVFNDGPAPTGLRFCLNSASLTFEDPAEQAAAEGLGNGPGREG